MPAQECPNRYFCELCKPQLHGPGGCVSRSFLLFLQLTLTTPSTSLLRKVNRKSIGRSHSPQIATSTSHASGSSSSSSNKPSSSKPRDSADSTSLARSHSRDDPPPFKPSTSHPDTTKLPDLSAVDDDDAELSPPPPPLPAPRPRTGKKRKDLDDGPAPKKRSTMNSRDAAYDDAIALSILEHGSAKMRKRLERRRSGKGSDESSSDSEGDEDEEDEKDGGGAEKDGEEERKEQRRREEDEEMEDEVEEIVEIRGKKVGAAAKGGKKGKKVTAAEPKGKGGAKGKKGAVGAKGCVLFDSLAPFYLASVHL